MRCERMKRLEYKGNKSVAVLKHVTNVLFFQVTEIERMEVLSAFTSS